MKSSLFKSLVIILGMMMSFSLVSCGDDDDDDDSKSEDPKAVAYFEANYSVNLDDDWFNFFDVTVSYVNIAGQETTEAIDASTSYAIQIPVNVAPDSINFKVHVTRKATIPAIEPDQYYHLTGNARLAVQAYLNDNSKGRGEIDARPSKGMTVNGENMEGLLDRYNGTDFFNMTIVLKK